MLLLNIDRSGTQPIHKQIADQIARLVDESVLEIGHRLPSSREMADKLLVNRTTVYRAYEELSALGYVESSPGSYTTVRNRTKLAELEPVGEEDMVQWDQIINEGSRELYASVHRHQPVYDASMSGIINFARLNLDGRLFPLNHFQRCLGHFLSGDNTQLLQYGDYAGFMTLRECIAHRLRTHGVSVKAHEILVTNGAQQALDLVFRLLAAPPLPVTIEAPTYSNVVPLLKYSRLKVNEIPMRPDGMDLNALEKSLRNLRTGFIYTMPTFHNPTGISTDQKHRELLLQLCVRHSTPIIEDGFEEEMKYFGKVTLPVKSMDKSGLVIYIGTFSKVLFPGLRIGWIAAAPECIKRLTAIKRCTDLGSNMLFQAAVELFIRQGHYDKHVQRMHRAFRTRMQIACDALREHLPAGVSWTPPAGGYLIWLTLPAVYSSESGLKNTLLKHRIMAAAGDEFFYAAKSHRHLRLSISTLNPDEIVEGIARLGKALREIVRK